MDEEKIMNPEEFKDNMVYIADTIDDKEVKHYAMDRLMGKVLTSLGYGEGVEIFEHTPKWYA